MAQLKMVGTQKGFPLIPPKDPLSPFQKNKECNTSLGGKGQTFLLNIAVVPPFLDAYLNLHSVAFRDNFLCMKNLAFNRTGTKPALNQAMKTNTITKVH